MSDMKTLYYVFCFLVAGVASREFPSYVPICQRNQKTIDECLKMATIAVRPYMAKGIKELGIPALEPLEVPMVKLEQGTESVNYKITLNNLKIYGLSNYDFKEVRGMFHNNGFTMTGKTDLGMIRLEATYIINGRVLLLPIQGNGDFTANITNCRAGFLNQANFIKKNGEDYIESKDSKLNLEIGPAQVHFGNLFNGDPVLSKTTNDFFNQNSKEIVNEIKPAIEAVVSKLVDDILNKFFGTIPYNKLFPQ